MPLPLKHPTFHSNYSPMKKLFWLFAIVAVAASLPACSNDDNDLKKYDSWRIENEQWISQMLDKTNDDGTSYYQTVVPSWNTSGFVLMHFFNDRAETADNLVPLYTSAVDVRYIGYNIKSEPFDSSYTQTAYGTPGVSRFTVNQVIQGWSVALMNMHVGDSAEVIIPYELAYGSAGHGDILPFSTLRFNLKLVDISSYEKRP